MVARNWELDEPDLDPMTFEPGMVAGLAVRLWRSGWWAMHRGDPAAALAAAEHLWGRECCPGSYMWRAAAAAVAMLAAAERGEAIVMHGERREQERPAGGRPAEVVESGLDRWLPALGGAVMSALALAGAALAGVLGAGAFWGGVLVGLCLGFTVLAAGR